MYHQRKNKLKAEFLEAKQLYIDNKHKEALKKFEKIETDILDSFDESLVHHYKALCLSRLMKLGKSIKEFDLAIKYRPNYGKIYLDKGMSYYFFYYSESKLFHKIKKKILPKSKSKLHKALSSFEHGLIVEPENADLWYYRGFMLELDGRHKEASLSYANAKKHNKKIKNHENSKRFENIKSK